MARLGRSRMTTSCSFCGKTQDQIAKLVAGPGVYICDECVVLCADIMDIWAEPPATEGARTPASPPSTGSPRFVLASSSVSRLRVLRDAGFDPAVVVSGVSEEVEGLSTPRAVVALAERKAAAVVERCPDSLVLGCDSMLDLEGEAFGKPASPAEALDMWRRLSGRQASLHTGHCLIDTSTGRRFSRLASSVVQFGVPGAAELGAYVVTREPLALAGAFSIEGLAGPFVEAVHGSPSNVLGLSLPDLRVLLAEVGVRIADLWRSDRM